MGIKPASIYHHFPTKADLGAAVAKRYWEDSAADLEAIVGRRRPDAVVPCAGTPRCFADRSRMRTGLCLGSFMSAEYDDLPDPVKKEVQAFADVNVAWLARMLVSAGAEKSTRANKPSPRHFRGRRRRAAYGTEPLGHRALRHLVDAYHATGLLPS